MKISCFLCKKHKLHLFVLGNHNNGLKRTEPTCYSTIFLTPVPDKYNAAFSYIVLRLTYIRGLILEFSQIFPIGLLVHPNELSSPIAACYCPTLFFGLDFHFYVIFFPY